MQSQYLSFKKSKKETKRETPRRSDSYRLRKEVAGVREGVGLTSNFQDCTMLPGVATEQRTIAGIQRASSFLWQHLLWSSQWHWAPGCRASWVHTHLPGQPQGECWWLYLGQWRTRWTGKFSPLPNGLTCSLTQPVALIRKYHIFWRFKSVITEQKRHLIGPEGVAPLWRIALGCWETQKWHPREAQQTSMTGEGLTGPSENCSLWRTAYPRCVPPLSYSAAFHGHPSPCFVGKWQSRFVCELGLGLGLGLGFEHIKLSFLTKVKLGLHLAKGGFLKS